MKNISIADNPNLLIAEFMGAIYKTDRFQIDNGYIWLPYHNIMAIKSLKYNTSWDWLMPVFEKIESFIDPKNNEALFDTSIYADYTEILKRDGEILERFDDARKISHAYKAIVGFIKWYNENK